ncbi:hypothetical protein EG68_08669 [Paragonimus skrjabini miyazakii]|uniref:Uncharacterized protein n=1 Tax=Paragonimus skrjabini miyazakii TaxID=59628 RepID=A0A8S9YIQ3_9TREM|nr:hypothetical protein EG68_08669 [Paragonimus skrjabini miyazakii]
MTLLVSTFVDLIDKNRTTSFVTACCSCLLALTFTVG